MSSSEIELDDSDRRWLEREAARLDMTASELLKRGIDQLRREREFHGARWQRLLEATAGTWRHGDGLEYQRRIRGEWA